MRLGFRLKHYLFNAFRELFVHHHGSLEFRAKVFALVVAADETSRLENFITIKDLGLHIYEGDEDRANLLMLTTKELVQKVRDNNGLNIDTLVADIQQELRIIPRYAKKIDIKTLRPILALTEDEDTLAYQENILEFLEKLKDETLHKKRHEIDESEKSKEKK
ncbi:MAG: hypothetical protein JXQ67_03225 [Campylobacterales bacterium]|nr:hypothetical protein [Campylobacterales bacterium]